MLTIVVAEAWPAATVTVNWTLSACECASVASAPAVGLITSVLTVFLLSLKDSFASNAPLDLAEPVAMKCSESVPWQVVE